MRQSVAPARHRHHSGGGDLRRGWRLFRRFAGGPRTYVVGLVLLALEAATAVVEPWPIAYLVDFLQGARPGVDQLGAPAFMASARYETILLLTVAIVLIVAVNSAADSLAEVSMARGGRSLGYNLRVAMYSHLQRLPLAYHDRRRTGDVLTRVTGDVLVIEDFVVVSVSNIVGSLMVLVGSFVFLLNKSWGVALVAVIVIPVLAVVSNHYSHRIKVASKTQRDREGELASTAQEMLGAVRLVQSYGRGTVDLERFSGQTEQSMHASLRGANVQARFSFVIALVEALSICAVIWLGVWLVDRAAITIGTLVLFVLLLENMFKPARKIVSEWYKVGKVFASVERIQDLLDREVVVRDLPGAVPAPALRGSLSFRDVGFAYPVEREDGSSDEARPQVLSGISFDVAPGEVVALVGTSGAGKSTIAQLVPRLYDPDRGEVLVDGLPVRSLTLASLRSQVSLVLQDTVLLSGTVAENIGYGIEGATEADVEVAARMANAHEFIAALPDGYRTRLGERAATLSGGQRQRIAIARAFIRRAPLLILDEPTTGLDHESARSVVGALRTLMRGTTTLVISHDPGLIRCADRVLVIAEGRIAETGRHEDLLRSGGSYARLRPSGELLASSTTARTMPSRSPGRLLQGLSDHLPGLVSALDPERAADRLQRTGVEGIRTVEGVSIEKLWLRRDGSCGLRYRLRFSGPTGGGDGAPVVLARVQRHPALTLSRFPDDPDLPTLGSAVDPAVLARLEPFAGRRPAVTVVHHPRQGACVLRFQTPDLTGEGGASLFGKVYGDRRGDVVDGFLRALAREPREREIHHLARFPTPVHYAPGLRLLLTESLPGRPSVRELVKVVAGAQATPGDTAALGNAVRASGRALGVLHGSSIATAPVHRPGQELADLDTDLDLVGRIWPAVGSRLRHVVERLASDVPRAPEMVLSHGDFTPSQVLLDERGPAVVDLDTLCWADPALDLGRYLAHLELLAVKVGGRLAREVVATLTGELLEGYHEVGAGTRRKVGPDRIAFYQATTLARTALHSCRQLKDSRLELAESLLVGAGAGRVTW